MAMNMLFKYIDRRTRDVEGQERDGERGEIARVERGPSQVSVRLKGNCTSAVYVRAHRRRRPQGFPQEMEDEEAEDGDGGTGVIPCPPRF